MPSVTVVVSEACLRRIEAEVERRLASWPPKDALASAPERVELPKEDIARAREMAKKSLLEANRYLDSRRKQLRREAAESAKKARKASRKPSRLSVMAEVLERGAEALAADRRKTGG